MIRKTTNIVLILMGVALFSCSTFNQKNIDSVKEMSGIKDDTLHADTVVLRESFQEEDIVDNEYLSQRLKPIRVNFKRINSIVKWTSTDKKKLNETTEGGEAIFFYSNGNLEKVVTRHFGETFQQLTEYYLLTGKLSFVFEKSYKYNRPIYYDSTSMKDNNDKTTFNFGESEIIEVRNYFENLKLVHQVSNQDCGSPFADDYLLQEQKRLSGDFIN